MGAMGALALTALREQPADLRLATEKGKYLAIEKDTFPSNHIVPAPAVQALPTGWQRPEVFAAQEVADLLERVRDLEVENAHLHRQIERAREAGRRDERIVKARTMGGKVLSIFVGGDR